MKSWREAAKDAVVPGMMAGIATAATAAARGKADSGSAVAPINAASHVIWGDRAAAVETVTARHTGLGFLLSLGAGIFWAMVFEKLFGKAIERHSVPASLAGAPVVAGLAYLTDYKLVPSRLTPGYEKRVSRRSLLFIYSVLALGLEAGALLTHRRRGSRME